MTNILKLEKISEKNLYDVLAFLFPTVKTIAKKTFVVDNKRMIVDWYFEFGGKKFAVEFDGPTHFTRTKTQLRDIKLKKYCKENNIELLRIPYFIQIDDEVIMWLFGYEFAKKHNLFGKIECEYPSGFIDTENVVLPADYNSYGVSYFCDIYMSFMRTPKCDCYGPIRSIYENAHMDYNQEEFIGISPPCDDIKMIWKHYPT